MKKLYFLVGGSKCQKIHCRIALHKGTHEAAVDQILFCESDGKVRPIIAQSLIAAKHPNPMKPSLKVCVPVATARIRSYVLAPYDAMPRSTTGRRTPLTSELVYPTSVVNPLELGGEVSSSPLEDLKKKYRVTVTSYNEAVLASLCPRGQRLARNLLLLRDIGAKCFDFIDPSIIAIVNDVRVGGPTYQRAIDRVTLWSKEANESSSIL